MERKREVPAVVAPIHPRIRRLGKRSSPICLCAVSLSLTSLAGLSAQPVQPPVPPAAAAAEAPRPAPAEPGPAVQEDSKPSAVPSPEPAHPPAAAQPEKPAAHPAPAAGSAAPEKAPPLAPTSPPPALNLERLRRAADLMIEVNTALGPPRSPYGEMIYDIAVRHSINPHLVAAVIHVESAFNPRAVSRKGACGLMQLLPETARRFGLKKRKDLFDPVKNLEAGVRYLKWLTKRFGGDIQKILAAYNAGEGAVERFGGIPPYRETQQYVKKVFKLLRLDPDPPAAFQPAPAVVDDGGGVPAGF